jgi:thiosulfate/3-mercaptopyruvate sulfurtransferase
MLPWISAHALFAEIDNPAWVVIDTRYALQNEAYGREAWAQAHIPGAQFLDIGHDLSGPPGISGGRHPLPDPATLAARLGACGIGAETHVVVYDDAANMFAGRLWWLLRWFGHTQVQVLDGGLPAWLAAGYPLTDAVLTPTPATFTVHLRSELLAPLAEIRARYNDPALTLVDARARERYAGLQEPLDPRAGHIPGALNRPFSANLQDGHFKSPEQLRAEFAALGLTEAQDVVAYCGSGVSANHLLMALEAAGIDGARLYPGSWSEWSADPALPCATGDVP